MTTAAAILAKEVFYGMEGTYTFPFDANSLRANRTDWWSGRNWRFLAW